MCSLTSTKTQIYANEDAGNEIQSIESGTQVLSDMLAKGIFHIGY